MRRLWPPDLGDGRDGLPGHPDAAADLVPGHVVGRQPEDGGERDRVAAALGRESYETAWTWLHIINWS